MANLLNVIIKPVSVAAQRSVADTLKKILGAGSVGKVEQLLKMGGLVLGDLNDQAANNYVSDLNAAGANAHSEPSDKKGPEEPPEDDIYLVAGRVILANGEPASSLLVLAYDKDLRSEQYLGQALTLETGEYAISYKQEQFSRSDKNSADLLLRVFNEVGVELTLKTKAKEGPDIFFNSPKKMEIDLQLEESAVVKASEYERLEVFLSPALDGATLAELSLQDINFLINETEISKFYDEFPASANSIHFIAQSTKLSYETNIPAEAFYGWARMELGLVRDDSTEQPTLDLDNLLEQSDKYLKDALEQAIAKIIIPAWLAEQIDTILNQLQSLRNQKTQEERNSWIQHEAKGILIDAASAEPLDGFLVSAETIDQDSMIDIDGSTTNVRGEFILTYALPLESAIKTLLVVLYIKSPSGDELDKHELELPVEQKEAIIVKITVPVPVEPGEELKLTELPISFSNDLSSFLEQKNLTNIAELRKLGSLKDVKELPESLRASDEIKQLQAHVDLSLLATDLKPIDQIQQNQFLIEKGYTDIFAIADTPVEQFASVIKSGGIVSTAAATLHVQASYISFQFDNAYIDIKTGGVDKAEEIQQDSALSCQCEDCVSALSPGAYLTDLIGYVTKQVELTDSNNRTKNIDLDFLVDKFHQPLSRLPINCEATKTKVRQVRIACEVLLSAIDTSQLSFVITDESVAKYRQTAYQSLLRNIGTSQFDLDRASSDDDIEAIANRLGIYPKYVKELQLQSSAHQISANALSEHNLERIFGLPAYMETYIDIDIPRVRLLDPLRFLKAEQKSPELYNWRLEHLKKQWKETDFPKNPLSENIPIIDPDMIGPDDFRHPNDENTAFKLWKSRREWADEQIARIYSKVVFDPNKPNGLEEAIKEIPVPTTIPITVPPTLEDLIAQQELLANDAKIIEDEAFVKWLAERHLSVDGLAELARFATDVKAEKIYNDEEWGTYTNNATNIIVNSVKGAAYKDWIIEEKGSISLDTTTFWSSLTEPKEGEWSLLLENEKPLLDPEKVEPKDLPDGKFGLTARTLWDERRIQLDNKQKEYADILESKMVGRLDAIMSDAFGTLPDIESINTKLNSLDQTEQSEAKAQITVLNIDQESFVALVSASLILNDADQTLSNTAQNNLSAALVSAYKFNVLYDNWVDEEVILNLTYWQSLKLRLPKWRASQSQRQQWQQALRQASTPPLIDPDNISGDVLLEPVIGNFAFDTWRSRTKLIDVELNTIRGKIEQGGNVIGDVIKPKAIEDLFSEEKYLGISHKEMIVLSQLEEQGIAITSRLQQMSLARDAYSFLLEVAKRVENGSKVLADTRENMYAILLQVWKVKQFAAWREEEENKLSLSPDFFKYPKQRPIFTTQQDAQKWRMDTRIQREWYRTLNGRIGQQETLVSSLKTIVSDVEEQTLPLLRNALMNFIDSSSNNLSIRAENLTKRFLIDMQQSGCQMTTRVSMALEVLQTLVFSIRSGKLDISSVELKLSSKEFEQEWKWMGSYAAWKAAMGVFLYPEQILDPSLRKEQTTGFKKLIESISGTTNFTSKNACRAFSDYFDYVGDVRNIIIDATCYAKNNLQDSTECGNYSTERKSLFHLFGRGKKFSGVYVSTYDWEDQQQTSWVQLPYLTDVLSIAGATNYNNKLIIFVIIKDDNINKLCLMRMDLETGQWEEPIELENPKETKVISAALVERMNDQSIPTIAVHSAYIDNPQKISILSLNSLNDDGTGWINNIEHWQNSHAMSSYPISGYELLYSNIKSAIETEQAYYLFLDGYNGTLVDYIMKNKGSPDDLTLLVSKYRAAVNDIPVGAFRYPYTNDVYGVFRDGTIKRFFLDERKVQVNVLNQNGPTDEQFGTEVFLNVEVDSGGFSIPQQDRNYPSVINFAMHSGIQPKKMHIRFGAIQYRSLLGDSSSSFSCEMKNNDDFDRQIDELRYVYPHKFIRLTPYILDDYGVFKSQIPFQPSSQSNSYDNLLLRASSNYLIEENMRENINLLQYIEELYYFTPVTIAIALSKSGNYQHALLWFRQVYNYLGLRAGKKIFDQFFLREGFTYDPYIIYDGLEEDRNEKRFDRIESWVRDPINPHVIASRRSGAYKRFTIQSIIRCLLDYADAEFTFDTGESVAKAKLLYQTALDLIQSELPVQPENKCLALIESLKYTVEDITLQPYYDHLKLKLGELTSTDTLKSTMVEVLNKLNANLPEEIRLANALEVIQTALGERKASLTATHIINKSLLTRKKFSQSLLSANLSKISLLLPRLANLSLNTTEDNRAEIETVEIVKFNEIEIGYTPRLSYEFCIPNNPTAKFLLLRVELNLFKIRNCMNIAGMHRELEPYSAPIDVESALPSMGAGGQINLAGVTRIRPTQYRYPVLVDRAKQLTNLAQQTEASFFNTLQSLGQEKYSLFQARQGVELSRESVKLQKLRVRESEDGVGLAELQLERTSILAETYADWLNQGMLEQEKSLIQGYIDIGAAQNNLAAAGFLSDYLNSVVVAATADGVLAKAAATASLLVNYAAGVAKLVIQKQLNEKQKRVSILSQEISIALRNREYELQHQLAEQDLEIGSQQIKLANDRVHITEQEKAIAEIQSEQASDTVIFLQEKFTNVELYNWMSGVLENIFRYYLQQAASMSKLAEVQLAFERQEPLFGVIKDDYYELPNFDGNDSASSDSSSMDRRGLTGSARLLRDITKLDQYAFTTDQRKQQLSVNFSLSQLDPFAFQQFKQTGVLNFDTSGKVFDRRFPGQYLRLIKQVRISVIALVPPVQGISATLTSSGISRVVIAGDVFQTVAIRRDPESIAFTNPIGASGVFDLNPNPEMLFPFEGNGVDTRWEFRLPKASNPMDFNTIADVLLTIEYTALHNRTYQEQVQRELDPYISFDRAFSFRQEFSDAWYDLHNPEQTNTPMNVNFETTLADFPSNVKDLSITSVLMYFIAEGDLPAKFDNAKLNFTQDGNTSGGVAALPTHGVIRNGGDWISIGGRVPEGKWTLELPNNSIVKQLFKDEKIIDILLVLTCEGELPR